MANGKGLTERRKHKRFKAKKSLTERRKHKRFKAKDTTFVVLKPHDTRLGQITDVSEKGIASYYLDVEERSSEILKSSEYNHFMDCTSSKHIMALHSYVTCLT